MNDKLTEFLKENRHLPKELKDIEKAKLVFQYLDLIKDNREDDPYTTNIDWEGAMIYTIDIFLWFMALSGYTLQKKGVPSEHIQLDEVFEGIKDGTIKLKT